SGLIAGSLVDRWNRQRVMIISDSIAGMCSLVILFLYSSQQLQVWHLYVISAIVGWVGTFQGLAFSAGLTMLIPKAQVTRARGMMSLAEYVSVIGAPLLGGLLIGILGVSGVLIIDILTFLFAAGTLFVVSIPQPPPVETEGRKPLWRDSIMGFQYIFQR